MLAPAPGCCVRFKVHGVEPARELMRPVNGPWRACCSLPLLHGTFLNCACLLLSPLPSTTMPCSRAVQGTPESLQGMSGGLRLPSGITRVWATSDSQPAPVAVAQGGWATFDCPLPAQLAEAAGPEQEAPCPVVMHAASGAPSLLAASVYESFYKHYPLRLNPNVLWVTITQGLARVIELDPSAFQGKFCCLGSRRALTVVEPEAASPADVPWQQAVASFAAQIGSSIGQGALALLTAPFSNTTPNDTVASQICLMDAMQSYFQCECTAEQRGGARTHAASPTHPPTPPPPLSHQQTTCCWAAASPTLSCRARQQTGQSCVLARLRCAPCAWGPSLCTATCPPTAGP